MLASARRMRHCAVNAVTREVQEARLDLGASTVKSVSVAVFAAVGLVLAGMPESHAGNCPAPKQSTPASNTTSTTQQSGQNSGQLERKCVIMSCGTPWCYNTRR
jgi:hypothetical protein